MTASAQPINMEQIERDIATQKQKMDDLQKQLEMLRTKGHPEYERDSLPATKQLKKGKDSIGGREPELEEDKKGRRPRPLTLENRIHLFQNQPATLRGVLERFCLQEMALQHWLKKRPILVGDFQTIERALSRINAHEIRSLPVVNKEKIVVGLIDNMDITKSIAESLKSLDEIDPTTFLSGKMRNDFLSKTVGSLLASENYRRPYIASNCLSLMKVTEYFVHYQQDRFMIVDREVEGNVTEQTHPEEFLDGICTQADVIRFLAQNTALLRKEPLFLKSLAELNLGQRTPHVLAHDLNSAQAFIHMTDRRLDSAAVVDDAGKLIATVSASDLKGLTRRNCVILGQPLDDFLNREWRRGWWNRPLTVKLEDPLYFVVLQFVSTKVHRMYVLDNDGKPIGELNLLDVLNTLLKIQ